MVQCTKTTTPPQGVVHGLLSDSIVTTLAWLPGACTVYHIVAYIGEVLTWSASLMSLNTKLSINTLANNQPT
jgi:hypothetical protein